MVQGVDVLNELFNEEELKEISDNNQINQGKPAQVIYWERRKGIEQRLQEDEADTAQLLDELKDVSPKWLGHSFYKGKLHHLIDYEKFLKRISERIHVIVTDKNPLGYHYTGNIGSLIQKLVK